MAGREGGEGNVFYGFCITLVILMFIVMFCRGFFGGNYWCTEDGVLGRIQEKNPEAVKVLYVNRHIFKESEVAVLNKDGTAAKYWLDCNILFNCSVYDQPEPERYIDQEKK